MKRDVWPIFRVAAIVSAIASLSHPLCAETLSGSVRDSGGSAVSGAAVSIVSETASVRTVTGRDGEFSLPLVGARATLTVEKPGFRAVRREILSVADSPRIEITLEPSPVAEQVTVVATRRESRLAETAASLVVIGAADLRGAAAPALDDVLRQVPGFTLFRRSGSRTANPTTQGVSLRGAGASGASRALVLDDGLPLNDPFGGWIYWGRVPRASLERVEVLRGGGSDLWGSGALSGVVQLVRREPDGPAFGAAEASYGSQRTAEASAFGGIARGAFRLTASGEALRTDGWVPVAEDARGAVDVEAHSRRAAGDVTVEHRDDDGRAFVRAAYFEEDRGNGTPYQVNDTAIRQIAAGVDRRLFRGALSVRGWGSGQDFRQTFSAIAADRSGETPTREQHVPADAAGVSVTWSGSFGSHALLAGLEGRRSRGESREEIFLASGSRFVTAGGEERSAAAFLGDSVALSARATATASLRVDAWENVDGRLTARPSADGDPTDVTRLADRRETAWSPRLSFLYRVSSALALSGSGYRSFRAPTGNELYRGFRVGNVETRANERLEPERLGGVEAGAIVSAGVLFARAVGFAMEIEDAIANVTVSQTPELVLRERRNLGRIRSRGFEVELEARLGARFRASAGYLFSDSSVREAPDAPELVGLRTPQVARHQGSAQVRYDDPRHLSAALQARWSGPQFEDDLNRLELGAFAVLDAVVSREIARGLDVFVAAENLFDERPDVGRTPVRTVGAPRTVRVGVRINRP